MKSKHEKIAKNKKKLQRHPAKNVLSTAWTVTQMAQDVSQVCSWCVLTGNSMGDEGKKNNQIIWGAPKVYPLPLQEGRGVVFEPFWSENGYRFLTILA